MRSLSLPSILCLLCFATLAPAQSPDAPQNPWFAAAVFNRLDLRIPRQTPNTFFLEPFHTPARVVRTTTLSSGELAVALEFDHPYSLRLD